VDTNLFDLGTESGGAPASDASRSGGDDAARSALDRYIRSIGHIRVLTREETAQLATILESEEAEIRAAILAIPATADRLLERADCAGRVTAALAAATGTAAASTNGASCLLRCDRAPGGWQAIGHARRRAGAPQGSRTASPASWPGRIDLRSSGGWTFRRRAPRSARRRRRRLNVDTHCAARSASDAAFPACRVQRPSCATTCASW
jgi:hypothetical protein